MRHQQTATAALRGETEAWLPQTASPYPTSARRRASWTWPVTFIAATSFALSGIFATPLQAAGWSPGATTLTRVTGGAIVLLIPALLALRGNFRTLVTNAKMITGYSLLAITATQLCFFQAIQRLDVAIALLIEYSAPLLVVLWMWVRHHHRPTWRTGLGAAIAVVGLLLIVDLTSSSAIDPLGVMWAAGAAVGVVGYIMISASHDHSVPPIALVASGMTLSAVTLALAGLVGLLPLRFVLETVELNSVLMPWWLPVLGLVVVSCALAYGAGIASARQLGPHLAGFVSYSELGLAFVLAWLILGQAPSLTQGVGAAILIVGILVVKSAERPAAHRGETKPS